MTQAETCLLQASHHCKLAVQAYNTFEEADAPRLSLWKAFGRMPFPWAAMHPGQCSAVYSLLHAFRLHAASQPQGVRTCQMEVMAK